CSSRCCAACRTDSNSDRDTATTPSSSAKIASPGCTRAPAQTTGTLIEPKVALTVPLAETALDQTGKLILAISATSRQPASITTPTAPRARNEVANSSPNMPSEFSELNPTTTTSP